MINDWKLGMRMLRYAHGIKMNCIAAGLVMLLGRHEVWHTGVNGVCGIFTEYYREEDGEKVTDAGILLIAAPDSVTFEDMRA